MCSNGQKTLAVTTGAIDGANRYAIGRLIKNWVDPFGSYRDRADGIAVFQHALPVSSTGQEDSLEQF